MNDFALTMIDSTGNIHKLDKSKVERDLGVYIQKDLKCNVQIRYSCNKAYYQTSMMSTLDEIRYDEYSQKNF